MFEGRPLGVAFFFSTNENYAPREVISRWLLVSLLPYCLSPRSVGGSRRRHALSRTPERRERRRSYRVALATPVFVYGWLADEPFSENTETLNVSANGSFLPLSGSVVPSQELILTNLQTNEDLSCRVARSIRTEDGTILVGLDFLQALPNFWQIDFVSNLARPNFPTAGSHSSSLVRNSIRKEVAHCETWVVKVLATFRIISFLEGLCGFCDRFLEVLPAQPVDATPSGINLFSKGGVYDV
jgi:hypothetical protein